MSNLMRMFFISLSIFAFGFAEKPKCDADLLRNESYTIYMLGGPVLLIPKPGHKIIEQSQLKTMEIKTVDLSEKTYKDLRGKK